MIFLLFSWVITLGSLYLIADALVRIFWSGK
jgi:hypothetical protein